MSKSALIVAQLYYRNFVFTLLKLNDTRLQGKATAAAESLNDYDKLEQRFWIKVRSTCKLQGEPHLWFYYFIAPVTL